MSQPVPIDQALSGGSHSQKQQKHQTREKPRRSWFARLCRFVLWTLLIVVLLLVVILGIIYWLAGTDSGFARVSAIASERVPGLSIEGPGGNVRSGITADHVSFANETIDLKLTGLDSKWQLGCLMQKRFCLDNLQISELDVTTFQSDEPVSEAPRTEAIELPDIDLPIDVSLTDVSIGTVRFQAPGDVPVQVVNDIHLSAETNDSVVSIDDVSLSYALQDQNYEVRLNGTVELLGDYPLDVSVKLNADDVLPDSVPEGEGLQPVEVDLALGNTLANLTVQTQISGLAPLSIDGTVQPLDPELPVDLILLAPVLGWPVQSLSEVQANDTTIRVNGTLADYQFSLQSSVAGEQLPDTDISISGIANTERVDIPTINIDTLGGNAAGSVQLALEEVLAWNTRWTLKDIDPSLQVPDLQGRLNGNLTANGELDGEKWSLNLDEAIIEGTLRDLPFRLDAAMSKGMNNLWYLKYITLNNDKNQIKAQGTVGDEVDIKADINLPQLQNFMPGLAGGFDATVVASGPVQTPDAIVTAKSDVLVFNDVLVRSLSIEGNINQLFVDTSTVNVGIDTIKVGENIVSDTALSLTGTRLAHQLSLNADGPQSTDIALSVKGSLDEALNWSGTLEQVQASVPEHQVSLLQPVEVQWQNARQLLNITAHCWSLDSDSELCLQNDLNMANAGAATVTLDKYSLSNLNNYLPENTALDGTLAAHVDLSWGNEGNNGGDNDRRAVVVATIDQANIETQDTFGDSVSFGYDTITLDADLKPDDARATLELSSSTLGTANIALQLDPSDPDQTIEGSLALNDLQLSIAEAFLPDFDLVSGAISAKGTLAGTLVDPQYTGYVKLEALQLESETLPLPVTDGEITASIYGQRLQLSGNVLSNEGRVDITGRGTLNPANWNAEVNLKGENLNLQSDPLQESSVNHDIKIVVNSRRVSITGDIRIPMAVIDVEELPEGAAMVSGDVVIVEDEEQEEEQQDETPVNDAGFQTQVSLEIALGEEITVAAYGLTAKLKGDIDVRVRGNRPPQLGGEITVYEGIFKKYGQDLEADGQILFVGPVDSTRLDLQAVREIDNEDRTAGLRIQGTITTPEITLFTEPSDKSQDSILSYIVLGRDINEASDQEADLLATAALALAVKGGRSIGSGVANRLGVQEFGLETTGRGDDTELVVSGRINDRLEVRYGRGVFDAQNTLYLRYDLTRKLYLEAAQGAQEAVDLFYSFAF